MLREIQLSAFNLLLNHATAAAKLAQSKPPAAPASTEWAEAAADISRKMSMSDGQDFIVDINGTEFVSNPGPSGRARNPAIPYASHPLMAPAIHFPALAKAVAELDDNAEAWAAEEIAKHLAVAFERDGSSFLAFPQQGSGLKLRKNKAGMEVFDWESDWSDKIKRSLPSVNHFSNTHARYRQAQEGTPNELAAMAELSQYWSTDTPKVSIPASHGDIPLLGVHLEGKLTGSASSESPLNTLAPLALPSRGRIKLNMIDNGASMMLGETSIDPAKRRLGWLAVALLLGDKLTAEQAASGHSAPSARAEASMSLENGRASGISLDYHGNGGPSALRLTLNGAARASRPAISCLQCAMTLSTWLSLAERRNEQKRNSSWNSSSPASPPTEADFKNTGFPYAYDGSTTSNRNAWTEAHQAKIVVKAVEAKAAKIMEKAYAIAKEFEKKWHERHGLSKAMADALLLSPNATVSAKALNWALANPSAGEALLRAKSNPQLGFASRTARYVGVRSTTDEETISRSRAAWEAKGLGDAGFDGLSLSPACADFLAARIQYEMDEAKRGPERDARRKTTELSAQMFQAAFSEGASAEQALAFAQWGALEKHRNFIIAPAQDQTGSHIDAVSPSMPRREISSVEDAAAFHAQAKGRALAYPSLMASIFRAFTHGEGMPPSVIAGGAKAIERQADEWLSKATRGSQKAPSVDWTQDLSQSWLVDFARRSQGPLASAMRQASSDGVHGAFAARVAVAIGVKQALDGNDLISQVRDALKNSHGLGPSGWKSLRGAEPEMREALAKTFEKNEEKLLHAKAQFIALKEDADAASKVGSGLSISLLSWSAQFGIPLDAASAIARQASDHQARGGSQLLLDGVRPIEANNEQAGFFAWREAKAKAERMPRIMKSLADRFAKDKQDALKLGSNDSQASHMAFQKMSDSISLIDDWLANTEDGLWQTLPPKADIADLMRRQHDWHEDVVARAAAGEKQLAAKGKAPSWSSPLHKHVDGDWSATLLGTASDLVAEGKAMHHCVSSYASKCKEGSSRIFSVKLNGERATTLEMKLVNASGSPVNYSANHPSATDVWRQNQNLGSCNAQIKDPSALAFCAELVAKMNQAHLEWIEALAAKRSAAAKAGVASKKIRLGA